MNVTMLVPRPATVRETVGGVVRHQLNACLWRITRPNGEVLGYVEQRAETARRFHTKRMLPDRRSFLGFGDFSDFEEAVEALRR